MDISTILEVTNIILFVSIEGLALYFQTNSKLKEKVISLINEAEYKYSDIIKAGGIKHTYVTEKLYSYVPIFLKPIFTQSIVSSIVDNAFASIESYAKQQLDKTLKLP